MRGRSLVRPFGNSAGTISTFAIRSASLQTAARKSHLAQIAGCSRSIHGILEFQAMVSGGLSPVRTLKAATSVAAELLGREDIGVLEWAGMLTSWPCPGIQLRTFVLPRVSTL